MHSHLTLSLCQYWKKKKEICIYNKVYCTATHDPVCGALSKLSDLFLLESKGSLHCIVDNTGIIQFNSTANLYSAVCRNQIRGE